MRRTNRGPHEQVFVRGERAEGSAVVFAISANGLSHRLNPNRSEGGGGFNPRTKDRSSERNFSSGAAPSPTSTLSSRPKCGMRRTSGGICSCFCDLRQWAEPPLKSESFGGRRGQPPQKKRPQRRHPYEATARSTGCGGRCIPLRGPRLRALFCLMQSSSSIGEQFFFDTNASAR